MNEEKKEKKETISYFKYVIIVLFAIGLSVLITINLLGCSLEQLTSEEPSAVFALKDGFFTDVNGNPKKIAFYDYKEGVINVKVYYGKDDIRALQFPYEKSIKWPLNSLKSEELIFNEAKTQFTIASSTWEVVSGN